MAANFSIFEQFLGFPYMAANFSILDSGISPNKKIGGKKKVIKTTPKKGHEHYRTAFCAGPLASKKKKSGLSRRKLVVLGW
jgi:hypothetical protein